MLPDIFAGNHEAPFGEFPFRGLNWFDDLAIFVRHPDLNRGLCDVPSRDRLPWYSRNFIEQFPAPLKMSRPPTKGPDFYYSLIGAHKYFPAFFPDSQPNPGTPTSVELIFPGALGFEVPNAFTEFGYLPFKASSLEPLPGRASIIPY